MAFQWDERKRLRNIAKHGFDFLQADELFEGPHVIVPRSAFWRSARWPAGGRRSSARSAPASIASSR
jgi:uncharacterized DUF497 family protein